MVSFLKIPAMNLLTHWKDPFSSIDLMPADNKQGKIALYDAHHLEHCPWDQTLNGHYAKAFLTPLIKTGVSQYIENIQTDLRALVIDEWILPVTINQAEYENSYVCSPYSYYISYAKNSLDLFLSQAWLRHSINGVLAGLGKILRQLEINKVVMVNNWLYSTNLYPQLQPQQLTRIVHFLQQLFPDYAIIFRSVDPYTNPVCYQTLQQMGFEYIATRQIFFIDPHASSFFESRLFKSDLKLLKNSEYEVIEGEQLTENDIPRLLELYRDVYIDKYSGLNPKFNSNFLRLALEEQLWTFKALKREGQIDGIIGYMQCDGKMYCPFFGYDRHVPKEKGLYRLLSTVLILEAYDRHLFFHQSAGASMFKKIRKAHSCIEYTAVFYKHLKIQRHIPWLILKNLYNSLGIIYMKRY